MASSMMKRGIGTGGLPITPWYVFAAFILLWRAASLWQADDAWVTGVLNLVGMTFLWAGLFTVRRGQFGMSALAGAFLMCQAIHWGGPVIIGSRIASIVFYLLVSGVLAQTLLLHFALGMFRGEVSLRRRVIIYAPVVATIGLGVGAVFTLRGPETFLLVQGLVNYLYAIIALLLLIMRPGLPRYFGFALLAGWVPPLVVSAVDNVLDGIALSDRVMELLNGIYIAIPLGFVFAQLRRTEIGLGDKGD